MEKKRKFKFPNTATLLLIVVIVMGILTYIIPAGQFDREINEATGREGVVAGSFHYIEQTPISPAKLLEAPYWGFLDVVDIIAIVFIIGGSMGVIIQSGAIHAGIGAIAKRVGNRSDIIFIILMLLFSAASTFLGMAEELIVFVPLLVSIALSLGYDKITAVAVLLLGIYGAGGFAIIGPFNTMIAQSVAGVELLSGMGLRTIGCIGAIAISIHHVLSYGHKERKKREETGSVKFDKSDKTLKIDEEKIEKETVDLASYEMTTPRIMTLLILVFGIALMAVGVYSWGWWFEHMSAIFFAMAIVAGMINNKGSFDETVKIFLEHAASMASAAILLALSRAIIFVISEGQIMDTIVYAISIPLSHLNGVLAAWGIYISQIIVNFFVPSSTGQAMVMMPILTPLADLSDLSRQVAVHAFTTADYFGNMIIPTHPTTLACLAIAGISYDKWFKFVLPMFLKWTVWTFIILAIGVATNWAF